MNAPMSEAQSGEAVLQDVDGPTFARFCHWAYADFYPAAEFCNRRQDVALAEQIGMLNLHGTCANWLTVSIAELALVTPADSPSPPPRRAKKHTTFGYGQLLPQNAKETMKESFLELHLCKPDEERIPIAPRANSAPSEDYTNVFLSHAHVYVFAEKFDIQPLKRLALKNLHQTLAKFTLWPECVGDIVALARFMYTPMFELFNEAESMRSILKRYIGYEMDVLIRAADFRDLLEENRELLDDVCSMVGERIK